jgi:hypothetical protein
LASCLAARSPSACDSFWADVMVYLQRCRGNGGASYIDYIDSSAMTFRRISRRQQ